MPEFISKVQHNTYEKGEFSDEKVRTLDETIDLIRVFPWDNERTLTVIQLTGPSITIQDEYVNYLKVGLYFNGKFCLYYLDRDNHLYEYHAPDIAAVNDMVASFFDEALNLGKFEKHLFSINSKRNFETAYFEYTINKVWFFLTAFTSSFLLLIALGGTFAIFKVKSLPWPVIPLYLLLDALTLQAFYLMVKVYLKANHMLLNISNGKETFKFGTADALETYEKTDIVSIDIYGQTSRSSRIYNVMNINFKDMSVLTIPGILIEPFSFIAKFPGKQTNFVSGYFIGLKAIWNFTK